MPATLALLLVGLLLGAAAEELAGFIACALAGLLAGLLLDQRKQLQRLQTQLEQLRESAPAVSRQTDTAQAPPDTETAPLFDADWEPELEPLTPASSPIAPASAVSDQVADHRWSAPVPAATAPTATPAMPAWLQAARDWLVGGNPIVRVGMLVLLVGLGLLLRYLAGRDLFSLPFKLAGVAALGLLLLVLGWRSRQRSGGFGLVLQGGGLGILYLTLYAGGKLYELMPLGVSLATMLALVVVGALLALRQNAQSLALMATTGGFLAPLLTSDGSGNHILLFSYMLLLNLGVLALAWFRQWRLLNWTGFVFTFGVLGLWCLMQYQPQHYLSGQLFSLLFFLLYLIVSLLFALRQPPQLRGLVDASLVFGLPLVMAAIQALLLESERYAMGFSAILLAALYAALWLGLRRLQRSELALLQHSFMLLGLMFATLSIPLLLGAQWTAASWALEAVGLLWIGLRQRQWLPRIGALLLYPGAWLALLLSGGPRSGTRPLLDGDSLALLLLSLSALAIGWLWHRLGEACLDWERRLSAAAVHIGWLTLAAAGALEVSGHLQGGAQFSALLLWLGATALLLQQLAVRLNWPGLAASCISLLPLALLVTIGVSEQLLGQQQRLHPAGTGGWLALLLVIAAHYLWLQREAPRLTPDKRTVLHLCGALFMLLQLWLELFWWQQQLQISGTAAMALWFLWPALPLGALWLLIDSPRWPFAAEPPCYHRLLPALLCALLLLWLLLASLLPGSWRLVYIPLLNPLEMLQLAGLLLLLHGLRHPPAGWQRLADFTPAAAAAGLFWMLNLMLLRSLHQHAGIAWDASQLWHSGMLQTGLSLLWSLSALALMVAARQRQQRLAWQIGAGLLGLVVAKLFLLDLADSGSLTRIVSFVGVGGLMLLIGYLAPQPARPPAT